MNGNQFGAVSSGVEGQSIFGYANQHQTPSQYTPSPQMGPSTQGKMIGNDLLNMLNYNSSANSQTMASDFNTQQNTCNSNEMFNFAQSFQNVSLNNQAGENMGYSNYPSCRYEEQPAKIFVPTEHNKRG